MNARILFLMMWMAGLMAQAADPVVSNVWAEQRADSKLVAVRYSVEDKDGGRVDVSLKVTDGGNEISATSLVGDIGDNIRCGKNKYIEWDAGADWNGNLSSNVVFEVSADDGVISPDRFVEQRDGTLLDTEMRLAWVIEPEALSGNFFAMQWADAVSFCESLIYKGYDDWRLPTRAEAESLLAVDYDKYSPILVQNPNRFPWYWTGTREPSVQNAAYMINLRYYQVYYDGVLGAKFVWPVRSQD